MKIPFKKQFFIALALLFIGFFLVVFGTWYFNPQNRVARYLKEEAEHLKESLQSEEQKYRADPYGGKAPQETYQMFLEALQNENIDLASKYFILDKQETYKRFFGDIKNNNKWDEMLRDLLKPQNQQGEMKEDDSYVVRVYNDQAYLIAQAVLRTTKSFIQKGKQLSDIWKIVEF